MNISEVYSALPNKAPNDFELQVFDDNANYQSTIECFKVQYRSQGKKKNLSFAIIHNLLTDSECKNYIDESERAGYTRLGAYQMSYRSNDRVIIVSQSLAHLLFKRLSNYFPDTINHCDSIWEPVGLNEVFRLCRYGPGGAFDAHRDAHFTRSPNE